MKQLSKIYIFFFITNYAIGQGVEKQLDSTYITFKMGQSSTNKFTKDEPLKFLATFPNNSEVENSWLVNAYTELAYNREQSGLLIGVTGEIQKNTLIDKEQDVRQFGLTFAKDLRIPFTYEVNGEKVRATQGAIVFSGSLKHSYNNIKKESAFQAHLGFSYSTYTNQNTFLSSDVYYPSFHEGSFGRIMMFNHKYNLGLGYLGGEEKVLFGKADFQITTFLLGGLMCRTFQQYDFLQVKYSISARAPISGTPISEQNPLRVFSAGINYNINETNTIELSYNWNKGADPFTALANQNFETILIKLKVAFNNEFQNKAKREKLQAKNLLNNCGIVEIDE